MNYKPIIGIMPTSTYMSTDDPLDDYYQFRNCYVKKIREMDGVPLPITLDDEKVIPEVLEMCDGLVLPGGAYVKPVNFEILDYFVKAGKPVLGICLGMQTIAMYSVNQETPGKRIMKKVDTGVDHWPIHPLRGEASPFVHRDFVEPGTILAAMIGEGWHDVNSFHHHTVTEVGRGYRVTARSEDGLIEGVEATEGFVVGVQFHPEVVNDFNGIWAAFIGECKWHKCQ